MDKPLPLDKEKIKSAIAGLPERSDPATTEKTPSPYQGLDRFSVLVSSLGTLRIIFQNAASMNTSLDQHDCEALAAFIVLLQEDFENVLEDLYREKP